MPVVLMTGFEPFAGASLNPSREVLSLVGGHLAGGIELVTKVLPVEFDRSAAVLLKSVAECQPAAVVCLGQAEGRRAISFEQVAVNLDHASIPDNAGVLRSGSPIIEGGAAGVWSTLPVDLMVAAVRAAGVPAEVSLSAGAFVCNHVFYQLQSALTGKGISSGFVHLPLAPVQAADFPGQPTLDLRDQALGLAAALAALRI